MGSEIIQAKIEINTLANSILKIPKLLETSVASQTLPKINFRKLFLRKMVMTDYTKRLLE